MKRKKPAFRARLDQRKAWERLNVLDMTQNELAQCLGRSSGFLSDVFNGKRYASPQTCQRLIDKLGVTRFEDLFFLEETGE